MIFLIPYIVVIKYSMSSVIKNSFDVINIKSPSVHYRHLYWIINKIITNYAKPIVKSITLVSFVAYQGFRTSPTWKCILKIMHLTDFSSLFRIDIILIKYVFNYFKKNSNMTFIDANNFLKFACLGLYIEDYTWVRVRTFAS